MTPLVPLTNLEKFKRAQEQQVPKPLITPQFQQSIHLNEQPQAQLPVEEVDAGLSDRVSKALSGRKNGLISSLARMGQGMGDNLSELGKNMQGTILGASGKLTQLFGNKSAVEKYSRGVNYGVDIAVKKGTTVALPPGTWEIVESFNGATAEGPNNKQGGINRGYGNSVLARNKETGELLRFSHLSEVGVQSGQVIPGNVVIGKTGATGNVAGKTGQHLDLEYYNQNGRVANVLTSPYAQYLM